MRLPIIVIIALGCVATIIWATSTITIGELAQGGYDGKRERRDNVDEAVRQAAEAAKEAAVASEETTHLEQK